VQKTIHSDEHVALRELLVAKRRENDLTQTALADKLGMPQSFVSKVERGERLLDVIEFARYIAALGGDPVQVFSEMVRDSKVLERPTTPKTPPTKKHSRR
jgi:transcriptional regulator with XRE-family HTH domain